VSLQLRRPAESENAVPIEGAVHKAMHAADEAQPIRVVLVNDYPILREGTRALLERAGGLVVVAAAAEGTAALRVVEQTTPDIVLLDIRLPDISGIEVARLMRTQFPGVKVLVIGGLDDSVCVRALMQLGVRGYLTGSASEAQLVAAVRDVAAGGTAFMAEAARVLTRQRTDSLTVRECDVLGLLAASHRNAEVAAALSVSVKTVEFHVRNILHKLGAHSRVEAVRTALQHGITLSERPHDLA
jgi:DNA-binding NarL/FixJ family response regulator